MYLQSLGNGFKGVRKRATTVRIGFLGDLLQGKESSDNHLRWLTSEYFLNIVSGDGVPESYGAHSPTG